jgi:ATP-binding cassette subfamily F protein uup
LSLKGVSLTFGGAPLLADVEFTVGEGERSALVGRNGSGKSTLLKIVAGMVQPDRGERVLRSGTTVRYMAQEPDMAGFATTLAYAEAGLAPGDDPYRAQYLLEALGLSGAENPRNLSGGEARRAGLARALAPDPDVLILDEPTNHLDLRRSNGWKASCLACARRWCWSATTAASCRTCLAPPCGSTVGRSGGLIAALAIFEAWRDEVLDQEERDRHKLDRKILAELDWVRYGVTARRKRNQGRMRALQDMRQQRRDQRRAAGAVKFTVTAGEASGKLVLEAKTSPSGLANGRWSTTFPSGSRAATGSALSGRTGSARRRCSTS